MLNITCIPQVSDDLKVLNGKYSTKIQKKKKTSRVIVLSTKWKIFYKYKKKKLAEIFV